MTANVTSLVLKMIIMAFIHLKSTAVYDKQSFPYQQFFRAKFFFLPTKTHFSILNHNIFRIRTTSTLVFGFFNFQVLQLPQVIPSYYSGKQNRKTFHKFYPLTSITTPYPPCLGFLSQHHLCIYKCRDSLLNFISYYFSFEIYSFSNLSITVGKYSLTYVF
jgi:hypothetical protein